MGPHEYYDNWHGFGYDHDSHMPHLHNRGAAHTYLEPDWFANHMDAQLPAISTIGRGPRGEKVTAEPVYDAYEEDGVTPAEGAHVIGFKILDENGTVLVDSGNGLEPPEISVSFPDYEGIDSGQPVPVTISVTRQGETEDYTFEVPAGVRGSLVFLLDDNLATTADGTYTTTCGALRVYGKAQYRNKPWPRPDDVVVFTHGEDHVLAFGTIESVGKWERDENGDLVPFNTNELSDTSKVVFTSRVDVNSVRGLQGEQGPQGPQGEIGTVYYRKTEATVEAGGTEFVQIPDDLGYNADCILFAWVNGLSIDLDSGVEMMVVDDEYIGRIDSEAMPVGEYHFVCLKSVAAAPEDYELLKGEKGDKGDRGEAGGPYSLDEIVYAQVSRNATHSVPFYNNVVAVLSLVDPATNYAPAREEIVKIEGIRNDISSTNNTLDIINAMLVGWQFVASNSQGQPNTVNVSLVMPPSSQGTVGVQFAYVNKGLGTYVS